MQRQINIGEQIKTLLEKEEIPVAAFARLCGLSNWAVRSTIKGVNSYTKESTTKKLLEGIRRLDECKNIITVRKKRDAVNTPYKTYWCKV